MPCPNPNRPDLERCVNSLPTPGSNYQPLFSDSTPSETPLPSEATVLFQFLPSAICVVRTVNELLTFGLGPHSAVSFDLSRFNAAAHGVSGQHCRILRRDNVLVVVDLKSANGTYLNWERLVPHREYIISDGDRLILGTLHIIVTLALFAA